MKERKEGNVGMEKDMSKGLLKQGVRDKNRKGKEKVGRKTTGLGMVNWCRTVKHWGSWERKRK